MSNKIVAVANLQSVTPPEISNDSEQHVLSFYADYNDERNKEWSKYTPAFNATMTVIPSVAEKFEPGARYLVTFEKAE